MHSGIGLMPIGEFNKDPTLQKPPTTQTHDSIAM